MHYIEKSAPPPGAEPDEFVLSDDTIDRMGDVIDPKGWQLDRIKTPPPVLYNHNKDEQIGSWANIRQVGNQLVGRIVWADFTELAEGANIFATWCAAGICARCRSASGRWSGSRSPRKPARNTGRGGSPSPRSWNAAW